MTASEILLSLSGKHLDVWRGDSWEICVSYRNCEIKDGAFLISAYGDGDTFEEACADYLKQICGKKMVFNACTDRRE